MPERRYIALAPPRVRDRVWAHWAEVVFVFLGLKQALLVSLEPLAPGPGPGAVDLSFWQAATVSGAMVLGCGLWFFTILYRFERLSDFLKWQRLGLGFTGLAWLGLTLAGATYRPEAVFAWTTGLLSSVAAWGLFVLSWVYEARIHTITPHGAHDRR